MNEKLFVRMVTVVVHDRGSVLLDAMKDNSSFILSYFPNLRNVFGNNLSEVTCDLQGLV